MGPIPGISARVAAGMVRTPGHRTATPLFSSKRGFLSGARLRTQMGRRVAMRSSAVIEAVYSEWGIPDVAQPLRRQGTLDLKLVYEYPREELEFITIYAELRLVGKDGKELPEPVKFEVEPTLLGKETKQVIQKELNIDGIEIPKGFQPAAILVQSKRPLFPIKELDRAAFRLIAVTFTGLSFGTLEVPCFSWIEIARDESDPVKRCFFCTEPSLPKDTPPALVDLRNDELKGLRGELGGAGEERKRPDRIYEFDVYNDLIQEYPTSLVRPILGGKGRQPYPRRCRTGREVTNGLEHPLPIQKRSYLPRDADMKPGKIGSFYSSVFRTFDLKIKLKLIEAARKLFKFPYTFKDHDEFERIMYGHRYLQLKLPKPFVFNTRENLWKTDAPFADFEFGRQRIAGVNPCTIKAVTDIQQVAPVGEDTIPENLLDGKSLSTRISEKRIFTVDYRDDLLEDYEGDFLLNKINKDPNEEPFRNIKKFVYAPSCVLYLTDESHLQPVAIVLEVPSAEGKNSSIDKHVYTPSDGATEWEMAKGHFLAVDSAVHQLYSHFTRCHANCEVYAISMWRNLSALHPIFRLLFPHFKDTLRINAAARQALISAQGIIELSFIGGPFSMVLASKLYARHFRFKTEGLPEDLKKRGMATESKKGDIELTLKDYPYAQDGLLVWNAIEDWVTKYVNHYYSEDEDVQTDQELRKWWKEITDVGHVDIVDQGYAKYEEMWPKLNSKKDLVEILATIIWIASGHHAAINFGQFNYTGYMPTMPSICTSKMPEEGFYSAASKDSKALMRFLTPIAPAASIASLVEVLSTHFPDEEYLGEEIKYQFQDKIIQDARKDFQDQLIEAQKTIKERNTAQHWPSRSSKESIPYYLLSPYKAEFADDDPNKQAKSGVPNSVSI